MPISDEGSHVSISFQTTGFAARLESVDGPHLQREAIKTTHMATVGQHIFMPADLSDPGELQLTVHFDPSLTAPIDQPAETILITWPVPLGLTNGATWSASGFVTSYHPGAQIGQLMTATLGIKLSGPITITQAS